MNILFSSISIKDSPAGVFSRSYNLAKGLVKAGNHVTMLTTASRRGLMFNIENRSGIEIVSFPTISSARFTKFGYAIFPFILRIIFILFRKYDIVHADQHRPVSFLVGYMYKMFHRKCSLVCDWQDVFGKTGIYDYKSKLWKMTLGPLDNWLEIFSIKKSDGVVVLSERLYQKSQQIRKENRNIFKLWGGSDIDNIKFSPSYLKHREKFKIAGDEFIIGFVGLQERDYENNISVFKTLQILRNRGLKVTVARTGTKFSNDFIKKHNIGREVLEMGFISHAEYGKFLSCANVFMLVQFENENNLSRWPNVIGDYLAAGRPIIMNLMGELLEFKKKISMAIIEIKSKDEDYLIERFTEIYNNRKELCKSYEQIFEYAKNDFSWDKRATELEKFYYHLYSNFESKKTLIRKGY